MQTTVPPELAHVLVKCTAFRQRKADLDDLQAALWGTAQALTSHSDRKLREFFQNAEGRVELVRYTVEPDRIFDEVIKVVESVEAHVAAVTSPKPSDPTP